MDTQRLSLSPLLGDVMWAFDFYGTQKQRYESVTKREFLQAWQAFLAENAEARENEEYAV
jgi:uridine phosphorylase